MRAACLENGVSRFAVVAALLAGLMIPSVARAQDEAAAVVDDAPATLATPGSGTTTNAPKKPKMSALLCGCASSRFLTRGTVTLDGSTVLPAWLHGAAHIDGFTKDEAGKLVSTTLPTATVELPVDDATASASRFVHVTSTGTGDGLLGIVRPGDTSPRDVVIASLRPPVTASTTTGTGAPQLKALWLAPPESRDRRGCGSYLTERIAFELDEESPAIEAFLVKDTQTGAQSLVDARHAGAFGIGRVDVCDHGFPLSATTQTLEITPLSATWGRGAPWTVQHAGLQATEEALVDVKRISSPATADEDLIAMPFPVPGTPTKPYSMLSVGGVWVISAGVGGVAGVIGFLFWRFKKRRMETIRCSQCQAKIPVDVLDDKVDGFFCPSCGTAGIWKGKGRVDVDVTRL